MECLEEAHIRFAPSNADHPEADWMPEPATNRHVNA